MGRSCCCIPGLWQHPESRAREAEKQQLWGAEHTQHSPDTSSRAAASSTRRGNFPCISWSSSCGIPVRNIPAGSSSSCLPACAACSEGQRAGSLYKSSGQTPTNDLAQDKKNPAPIGIYRFSTREQSVARWTLCPEGGKCDCGQHSARAALGEELNPPWRAGGGCGGAWILDLGLGFPSPWVHPEEGYRAGSASCQAQGSGIVHSGAKEAQGRAPGSLQLPQEDREGGCWAQTGC